MSTSPIAVARALHAALEAGKHGEQLRSLFTADAVTVERPNLIKPRGAKTDLEGMLKASTAGAGLLAKQSYEVHSAFEQVATNHSVQPRRASTVTYHRPTVCASRTSGAEAGQRHWSSCTGGSVPPVGGTRSETPSPLASLSCSSISPATACPVASEWLTLPRRTQATSLLS